MAALVEGQQYGLSSHDNNSIDKTIIFVKLTDSALKSIEECVRDKSNSILKPSIQFQSNNGVIHLPNKETHMKSYDFTLSNVETDGPQGSFECLQQTGSKSLDSLGCMLWKMHINANEDSYEKTKSKMAAVEKENKKFCTKEIKPSGTYVGRKTRVKRPITSIQSKPSSPPSVVHAPKVVPKVYVNSPSISFGDSNVERHVPPVKNTKNTELTRQSCRDRIIHLLALKSYKKPELIVKLLSDGIKEKEKRGISAILSQVAVLKGNSYTLAPHAWHEVKDSWKFYSQEQAEIVRMRKNEAFNCSNENGYSSPTNSPDHSPSQKRTLEELVTNRHEQRSKKQRISHFNRIDNSSVPVPDVPSRSVANPTTSDKTDCDDKKNNFQPSTQRTTSSNMVNNYARKRSTNPVDFHKTNNSGNSSRESHKLSPNWTPQGVSKPNLPNGNAKMDFHHYPGSHRVSPLSFEVEDEQEVIAKQKSTNNVYRNSDGRNKSMNSAEENQRLVNTSQSYAHSPDSNVCMEYGSSKGMSNGHYNGFLESPDNNNHCDSGLQNVSSTMNGKLSPGSTHSRDSTGDNAMDCENNTVDNPDYFKEYVEITSRSQRARYKDAFNVEYEEYKALHDKARNIVNKFSTLENELNKHQNGTTEYFKIRTKIMNEYRNNCTNPVYVEMKRKLAFLHDKLSYIKKLVMNYDNSHAASQS